MNADWRQRGKVAKKVRLPHIYKTAGTYVKDTEETANPYTPKPITKKSD